jgi:hypothetical protein
MTATKDQDDPAPASPAEPLGERGVDVGGSGSRGRAHRARRWVLDRNEAGHLGEPPHRLFVHCREGTGRRERR